MEERVNRVHLVSVNVPLEDLIRFAFRWVFAFMLAFITIIVLPVGFTIFVIVVNS